MKKSVYSRVKFGLLSVILIQVALGCSALTAQESKIVFESYRDDNAEVYIMDVDGSNLVNLSSNPAYDGVPSWSPDGQQIAFTSERDNNPDIYLMRPDGSEPTQLTDGGGYNVIPAWSPDGSQILFASNRTYQEPREGGYLEVPGNTKLWVIDADGSSKPVKLTSRLGLDLYGSWSPDGQSIVFMSMRDSNPEIYMLQPNKFQKNLTNNPASDLNPEWSPDGRKIAFMSDRDGNVEIFVLDLEENTLTNLTQNPASEGDPSWSPDGSKIAFTSDRDGNIEIYVMNADGTNPRRLTNHPANDIHPHWQPVP